MLSLETYAIIAKGPLTQVGLGGDAIGPELTLQRSGNSRKMAEGVLDHGASPAVARPEGVLSLGLQPQCPIPAWGPDYLTASFNALSARTLMTLRAGLALNNCSCLVKGLIPLWALTAGF